MVCTTHTIQTLLPADIIALAVIGGVLIALAHAHRVTTERKIKVPDTLPPFPVDDVTLNMLEHSMRGAYTVDHDGTHHLVGAEYSTPQLLDFLSGYDPEKVVPLKDEDGYDIPNFVEYVGGPVYSRDCVIKALIKEVRRLRAEANDG